MFRRVTTSIHTHSRWRYQQRRLADETSPKTINLEIGTLRAILRHYGLWASVQQSVKMLPVNDEIGRALSAEEERALLNSCAKSRSRSLSPFVILAIETGARYGVLRTLQWKRVDFLNRCLQFGKDKTVSGTGRFVPLSQLARHSACGGLLPPIQADRCPSGSGCRVPARSQSCSRNTECMGFARHQPNRGPRPPVPQNREIVGRPAIVGREPKPTVKQLLSSAEVGDRLQNN